MNAIKYIGVFLSMFFITYVHSQIKAPRVPDDNEGNKSEYLIYPGCENLKGDKQALHQCFNEKLNKSIVNNIEPYNLLNEYGAITTQLNIRVNKEGNLELLAVESDDPIGIYEAKVVDAFNRVQNTIKRKNSKGKGIKPVINSKGEKINIDFNTKITLAPNPSPSTKAQKRALKKEIKAFKEIQSEE